MAFAIYVIYRQQRILLTQPATLESPASIPAEYVTFEIEGDRVPEQILLDHKPIRLALDPDRKRGHLLLDAFRSVGFHCLQVNADEHFFATDDAKLTLNGILALLKFIERDGLSWGRQLFFSDGTAIRDQRVDYAWLRDKCSTIVEVADAIASRPARLYRRKLVAGPPQSGRIALVQTISLLRRRQLSASEPHARGLIEFRGRKFMPRVAINIIRERSVEHIANLRAARLLMHARELATQLNAARDLPADARAYLTHATRELDDRLNLFPFATFRDYAQTLRSSPVPLEVSDERYSASFRLYEELTKELGWEPSLQMADRFAYVGYADQIYQAFVTLVLARAVNANRVDVSLRPNLRRPAFRSDRIDLFYDTVPPGPEFRNWRTASIRPAEMRPDLTVIDRRKRLGVLVDAKYRVDRDRVPTSGLDDCHVYMQAFECKSIVVCFPGSKPGVSHVSADGYDIVQVSLGPFDDLGNYVENDVWPAIEGAMRPVRV